MNKESKISKLYEAFCEWKYALPVNQAIGYINKDMYVASVALQKRMIETSPCFYIGDPRNMQPVAIIEDLALNLPYDYTILEFDADAFFKQQDPKSRIFCVCSDFRKWPMPDAKRFLGFEPTADLKDLVRIFIQPLIYGYNPNMDFYQVQSFSIPIVLGIDDNKLLNYSTISIELRPAMKFIEEAEIEKLNKHIGVAVYYTLALMNCSNVTHERVDPPERLQKARKKKGSTPLFTYRVLTIKRDRKPLEDGEELREMTEDDLPKRASPRLHTRRGHIRRIPSGKLIWIDSMLIGKGPGRVEKDYRLIF